jgi:Tfp pilus assembly protein PilN
MILINLLPVKVRKTEGAQKLYGWVIIGLIGVAALLTLLLIGMAALTQSLETRTAQLTRQMAAVADQSGYVRSLMDLERQSRARRDLVLRLLPDQALWIRILDDVAEACTDDVWLTQLAPLPAKPKRPGPLPLLIAGEAYTKLAVADFLTSLEGVPRIAEVKLEELSEPSQKEAGPVRFKLTFAYRPLEGSGARP